MVPMADGDVCSRCGKIRVYHDDAGCDRFVEQATLYPHHHPWELEPHYSRHVSAMTTEQLHHKSAIAEQLAWRDQVIESLRAQLADRTIPTHWTSNGEAGDGQTVCDGCETPVDEESPHTFADCRKAWEANSGQGWHEAGVAQERIRELETQLAEREGLERERDAWLAEDPLHEITHDVEEPTGPHRIAMMDCGEACFGGKGPDYWQALRAALDEAEKGKT